MRAARAVGLVRRLTPRCWSRRPDPSCREESMSARPRLWTSSCRILFARRGQSRDWPETCSKVN